MIWRLLLFVLFIILIQKLSKSQQEQQKQREQPAEEGIKDYFRALGLDLPPEAPREQPLRISDEPQDKGEDKQPEPESAKGKVPSLDSLSGEEDEEKDSPAFVFSEDRLVQGIILSVVLGRPKAHQT